MPGTAKKRKNKSKHKTPKPVKPRLSAVTADKHDLYEEAVQNVEAEIDFVDQTFRELRGRDAVSLREDFCGTGNTSCEWVRRRPTNTAVGLDIDRPTLDWGREHKVSPLTDDQKSRVRLIERDVLAPGDAVGLDCILAMNFSYWLFMTRAEMVNYLRTVRESLGDDGVFFQDFYGGYEAMKEQVERRKCEIEGKGKFTYVWDQHKFTPVTGEMQCRIHFEFPDGTKMKDAFIYDWRLWSLTELQDCLADAGFSKTTIYWEGDELDDDGEPTGEGDGDFKPSETGEADPAFICYIVSEK